MLSFYKLRYIFIAVFALFFFSFSSSEQSTELNEDEWVNSILSQLTLEERIGQLFIAKYNSSTSNSDKRKLFKLLKNNKLGGVNFQHLSIEELKLDLDSIQNLQQKSPLFLGFDGDIETLNQLNDSLVLPNSYSVSVANNEQATQYYERSLIYLYKQIGLNCQFGINANIDNSMRSKYENSLGTNPIEVSRLIEGILSESQQSDFIASIGLFPGYHSVNQSGVNENKTPKVSFDAVDLQAYRTAISKGVQLIQVGNYIVKSIDSTQTPLTLSNKTIPFFLNNLKYKGLLITDDLSNLKVAKEDELVLLSYQAGFDLIYGVENIEKGIKSIELAILNDSLKLDDLNKRVKKVLKLKYQKLIKANKNKTTLSSDLYTWGKKAIYEKSFVTLHNEQAFPLADLSKSYLHVSIGAHHDSFSDGLDRFKKITHLSYYTVKEAQQAVKNKLTDYDYLLISIHQNSKKETNTIFDELSNWKKSFPSTLKTGLVIFSTPSNFKNFNDFNLFNGTVFAFENNALIQEQVSQFIFGAIPSKSTLAFDLNSNLKKGSGVEVAYGGRPKFASLAELNMNASSLSKIDSIISRSIKDKVFPGCQVFVSIGGKIAYNKSFGHPTYEDSTKVTNQHIYDIASVTKIAASSLALMYLESQGRFSIDKKLNDYLPELVGNTKMATIELREMMAHQAGLPAWIPFYYKTLKGGKLDSTLYSYKSKPGFTTQVANDLWIMDSYADTIYKKIVQSKLQEKTYVYSDLGYYFIKKIVEKITQQPYDKFLQDSIYLKMGLNRIKYKPSAYFDLIEIIPTENDLTFRHKLIHGFVHDPGAAMLGGVGGHAGLFSTATDLACIMHLFMNNGNYGGIQYISPEVVKKYTSCQFCPSNRRGIGFDRPQNSGGGTCDKVCSQLSYGHSGFTGTLVWNDPKYDIVYVFLSNRVYPDAENWKIVKQSVRTNIQRVIYDAVQSAQLKIK